MITYFLLIGFASALVGVEFVIDVQRPELKRQLIANFTSYSRGEIGLEQVFGPIDRLRNKAVLMVAVILMVTVIVLTMFIKRITEPLQHMIRVSTRISMGELNQTVDIESNNELADLGAVINEITSNLQEIIIISRTTCQRGQSFADEVGSIRDRHGLAAEDQKQLAPALSRFTDELELLGDMLDCFSAYQLKSGADE